MKPFRHSPCLVLAVAVFLVVSCASSYGSEDEEFADKAVSLGYVAVAVDGYIKFGNPPPALNGPELVKEATKQNPDLLKPLADYFVTARRDGHLSSVLLCNKEKTRAIAEDSGCTSARLDGPLWKEIPDANCNFQLDLMTVCNK